LQALPGRSDRIAKWRQHPQSSYNDSTFSHYVLRKEIIFLCFTASNRFQIIGLLMPEMKTGSLATRLHRALLIQRAL
jgi:hypothetical protein